MKKNKKFFRKSRILRYFGKFLGLWRPITFKIRPFETDEWRIEWYIKILILRTSKPQIFWVPLSDSIYITNPILNFFLIFKLQYFHLYVCLKLSKLFSFIIEFTCQSPAFVLLDSTHDGVTKASTASTKPTTIQIIP